MNKSKIFVLGYFGYVTNQLNGQTIKTRNIYATLKKQNHTHLKYFDSQVLQTNIFGYFKLLYLLIWADWIVMIPAGNMLKRALPITYTFSKIRSSKIILIPVGGWLSWYISDKRILKYILSKIYAILPQTKLQVKELERMHKFKNLQYFPNYRSHNFEAVITECHNPFRLVFCARIHKLKGLDVIFSIADHYSSIGGTGIIIDFYGQINEPDTAYFNKEVGKYNFVNYRGVLSQDQIFKTLSEYDAMLFPTRHLTEEGFPGSILDAYIAGIPVIVSEWYHAHEFVDDNVSGFICDVDTPKTFVDKIELLRQNPNVFREMQIGAIGRSYMYSEKEASKILNDLIK